MYNTTEDVDRLVTVLRKVVAAGAARRPRRTPAGVARPEPAYPRAAAPSPREAADELIETFELFDSWPERYQYLLDLGKKLPPMPDEMKTEDNRVRGCQSTVFLSARQKPGTEDVVEFLADSDADLVRGLIAVLQRVFSGQPAAAVAAFDVEMFFHQLGLDQHLTLGRRNGLAAMVQRVRRFATELVPQPV